MKKKKGEMRVLKNGTNTAPSTGWRVPPKISLGKTPWDKEKKEEKKDAET